MLISRYPRVAAVLFAIAVACGGGKDVTASVQARLGTYEDGSGRTGVALLATLRDPSGSGPAGWSITLQSPDRGTSSTLDYGATGPGSVQAGWLPSTAVSEGDWEVVASGSGGIARTTAHLVSGGLPVPVVTLDGSTALHWDAIAGAASYVCRASANGVLQFEHTTSDSTCDLSGLPAGPYSTSVVALSSDLAPIANEPGPLPTLPERFDVSEARLGVGHGSAGELLAFRAAGGRIDFGYPEPGLAVWLSIATPDGTGTREAWELRITGPGLLRDAPLEAVYPANFPRVLLWAYTVLPDRGEYRVEARTPSGATLEVPFVVGEPEILQAPTGLTADGAAQGGARMAWAGASGASAYFASLYTHPTSSEPSQFVAGQWVAGTEAQFPAGTVQPGATYDAYVTAATADMTGGAVPTRVSAAENSYAPATFLAK